jgi:hypothetical protein
MSGSLQHSLSNDVARDQESNLQHDSHQISTDTHRTYLILPLGLADQGPVIVAVCVGTTALARTLKLFSMAGVTLLRGSVDGMPSPQQLHQTPN